MQEQQHSSMPPPNTTSATTAVYGGFWKRLGATIIDGIAIGVSLLVISFVLKPLFGHVMTQYIMTALGISYYIFMHGKFGATLGKMALNMRVVKTDSSPIGFGIATLRYSPFIVFAIGALIVQPAVGRAYEDGALILGVTQMLFVIASAIILAANARKRTIHDMLAGTVVVNKKPDDLVTV
jgi:uncharacterized RDD family membrane protein YckC